MNHPLISLCLLPLLAGLHGGPVARADELVVVAPDRAPIGPASHGTVPPLLGYLARPSGPGRFPAVVVLHGCFGFDGHDTRVASTLKSWGYVALALDSLGGTNMCQGQAGPGVAAEVHDAFAALRYLTGQPYTARDRVAVMGFSMGGSAALLAIDRQGIAPVTGAGFHAAVAYYPQCEVSSGVLAAPALVLAGERDDWSRAEACQRLAAHESDTGITREAGRGTAINLTIYPGATHAFDYAIPSVRYLGHLIQHDESVSRDAETRVRDFLRATLGDQPDKP